MTSILARLALVIFGFLVAIGGAELTLRLAQIGSDQMLSQDRELGLRFIESKSGLSQGSCFKARVSTNSHGWRSPETTWDKPNDVFRILVLGDSLMAALQVNDDETSSAVMEALLNRANLPKRVEVINLGVPSFGTDQEYLALREYGKKYKPDYVVLAFYAQNDVGNNSIALRERDEVYVKPYFSMKDGVLKELPFPDPTPYWIEFVRRVGQPFRLYPWMRDNLLKIPFMHRFLYEVGIIGIVPRDVSQKMQSQRYPGNWVEQSKVFRKDYTARWSAAWDITKALLGIARTKAKNLGARFLLVQIASTIEVMPNAVLSQVLPEHLRAELDPDKPMVLLRDFAANEGIDFLSLVPTFRVRIGQDEAAFRKYYLPCDGHWSAAGNRLAAETLAAYLEPIIEKSLTP